MALLIIKSGGDVNIPDDKKRTPLMRAAQKGNDQIAYWLIKHGANINRPDEFGKTPLAASIEKGKL